MSLINLLPEDYFARKAHRRANMLCLGLFGLVMCGVLGAALVSDHGLEETRRLYERVNDSYAEAGKLIEQMQQLEQAKHRMLNKASRTTGLLERVPRSYLLATITNALPKRASVKEFELATKRKQPELITPETKTRYAKAAADRQAEGRKAPPVEVTMTVVGMAATDEEVAQLIAALSRSPLVETVVLVYTQEKEFKEAVIREFKVEIYLRPDAEVIVASEDLNELARANATKPTGENR